MIIKTTRFGQLEVDPEGLITIPSGVLGFPEQEKYVLLDSQDDSPFKWLQAVDDPNLAFVLIDPELIDSKYKVAIDESMVQLLKIRELSECLVFAIVTLNKDPRKVTANFLGPIIINPKNRLGQQIVLSDSSYTARHKILA